MPGPAWNKLNKSLLNGMKRRLGSEWEEFAQLAESIGLLENNFVLLSKEADIDFALSMCATAVVSAANHYGSQVQLLLSRRLATWALMIEPQHVPAMRTLQGICQLEEDESGAAKYLRQEEATIDRIRNKAEADLSAFEHGALESLRHEE